MTGEALVEQARCYVGTPFRHRGSTLIGCDCAGLILGPARDLGLTKATLPRYGEGVAPAVLLTGLRKELECVWQDLLPEPFGGPDVEEGWGFARPGDVLCFKLASSHGQGHPRHLAYWSGSTLIHATEDHGVVEVPLDVKWRRRLHSVWRFRGLEDE